MKKRLHSEVCQHDYDHPVRLGRARYVCPKCKEDITMHLVLLGELEEPKKPTNRRGAKKAGKPL